MFIQSGTHNTDRFVEQEGAVVAREMQLSPFVMHRFGVWVELEGDVLDDGFCDGDFSRPNGFLSVSL